MARFGDSDTYSDTFREAVPSKRAAAQAVNETVGDFVTAASLAERIAELAPDDRAMILSLLIRLGGRS